MVYKYGNHLTPGLTEVRSYAAFFTSFPAEGLRVRFRANPGLEDRVGRASLHAAALPARPDRLDTLAVFRASPLRAPAKRSPRAATAVSIEVFVEEPAPLVHRERCARAQHPVDGRRSGALRALGSGSCAHSLQDLPD